jgi:hypothetical protein
MKILDFFQKYMEKMVGARAEISDKLGGAGTETFDKLEPELQKKWTGSATKYSIKPIPIEVRLTTKTDSCLQFHNDAKSSIKRRE